MGPIQKAEKYFAAFHILDQAAMELENELIDIGEFSGKVARARLTLQVTGFDETSTVIAKKKNQLEKQDTQQV